MKLINKTCGTICALLAISSSAVFAEEAVRVDSVKDDAVTVGKTIKYLPEVHGVVRPRWEMDTEAGESRFQVRRARVTLDGNIAPQFGYFLQVDLCDQGHFKFLDAYAKANLAKGLLVSAGQFIMPFGSEPCVPPATYIFANRSFMLKHLMTFRKVGVKAKYDVNIGLPLTIEAGIGNAGDTGEHNTWTSRYVGSGRLTLKAGDFSIVAGAMNLHPDRSEILFYNIGTVWKKGNWRASAQYIYEDYADTGHKATHSCSAWGDYRKDCHWGIINQWSVQARYDMITKYWNGISGAADNEGRHRATVGYTVSHRFGNVFADFMVDYEQYFYPSGYTPAAGEGNKLLFEAAVRF